MICPNCGHEQDGNLFCDACRKPLDEERFIITDEEIEEARREGQDIHISIQVPPPQIIQPEQSHPFMDFIVGIFLAIGIIFIIFLLAIIF